MAKRFQIIRTYDICGKPTECLCIDAGSAIVYGEEDAKHQVAMPHAMGHTSARYEELPQGTAWFDDENWIG
jgi:hypothetical protein